jgi:hypothetical protein
VGKTVSISLKINSPVRLEILSQLGGILDTSKKIS